jgi:DNA repair photolyase
MPQHPAQPSLPLETIEAYTLPATPPQARASVEYVEARSILTKGSGYASRYTYTLNPYSGCAFACDYCYAAAFAPTEEGQRTWGEWVHVKANAVELISKACRPGRGGRPPALTSDDRIYMATVTDPYQPVERQLGLTRAVLATMLEHDVRPALTVQTRSPLVTRDIDLFRQFERVRVNVTLTTDDDAVRRRYEPHAPSIPARLRTLETLLADGIPIGVSIAPSLPIRDVEAFAQTLLALDAAEYSIDYAQTMTRRFAAGTPTDVMARLQEDGWTRDAYNGARETIAAILGPTRPVFEGRNGFAPATTSPGSKRA